MTALSGPGGIRALGRKILGAAVLAALANVAVPNDGFSSGSDFLQSRGLGAAPPGAQRLLIATILDRRRRPHAVLGVRTEDGDIVLDNVTNSIRNWRDTRYVFLRMQDPNRPSRWVNVFAGG